MFVDQAQRESCAVRDDFRAGLPDIVGERLNEAVVVVDEQEPGALSRQLTPMAASP